MLSLDSHAISTLLSKCPHSALNDIWQTLDLKNEMKDIPFRVHDFCHAFVQQKQTLLLYRSASRGEVLKGAVLDEERSTFSYDWPMSGGPHAHTKNSSCLSNELMQMWSVMTLVLSADSY